MNKIVNMQFPYKENDEVLNGRQHRIEPLKLTKIPYYIKKENNEEYYLLYYRDLSLSSSEIYCTILLRVNNVVSKVPLVDYENIQLILNLCNNQREENIDEFFENITNINSMGFTFVQKIIDKVTKEKRNDSPALTASGGKPINPPRIDLDVIEPIKTPIPREEPIKKEQKKWEDNKERITIYITSNNIQYIKFNDPKYFDIISKIPNKKSNDIIYYLPGIGIEAFEKIDYYSLLGYYEIDYVKVNDIIIIEFDSKHYISKREYESIFGLNSSIKETPIEVRIYGNYVGLNDNELQYLNRHYGVKNKEIKSQLERKNETSDEEKIIVYTSNRMEETYIDLDTYKKIFNEQPLTILHYLPGIGNGSFVKLSATQEENLNTKYGTNKRETRIINMLKIYEEENNEEINETIDEKKAYLDIKDYYAIFQKELQADKYITFNKNDYYGVIEEDTKLYHLDPEEVSFVYKNYLTSIRRFGKIENTNNLNK